ncbi:hypothetical protein [Brevibacillus parabrevis]|uniref:hypothetical protein n=1 Tax=Brevibacillus parabrevis TaxID=54914 RepID=UPI002380201D|nr:hypothetical protein [Brevibacillus parabrevis]WDV94198.1 hypothetical protein PSE45_21550 [Brevibacillus parabrevis]
MHVQQIENRAAQLKEQLSGKIFAFPVDEANPFSKYAITMELGGGNYKTYPKLLRINEVAACIKMLLEQLKAEGIDVDYSRDVRFFSYQAQMDAPDVTMRRLKKSNVDNPLIESGVDVMPNPDDPETMLFSARGILKYSMLELLDKNPKGAQFMDEYFKLLAMRRYGKTAAAIKQEVRRMSKQEAIRWVERTYERYVSDSQEIMNIMRSIANLGS